MTTKRMLPNETAKQFGTLLAAQTETFRQVVEQLTAVNTSLIDSFHEFAVSVYDASLTDDSWIAFRKFIRTDPLTTSLRQKPQPKRRQPKPKAHRRRKSL